MFTPAYPKKRSFACCKSGSPRHQIDHPILSVLPQSQAELSRWSIIQARKARYAFTCRFSNAKSVGTITIHLIFRVCSGFFRLIPWRLLSVRLPQNIDGGLHAAADIETHCGVDTLVPHELHQNRRHDPECPPVTEGSPEIMSGSVLDFLRPGIHVDDDARLLAHIADYFGYAIEPHSLTTDSLNLGD